MSFPATVEGMGLENTDIKVDGCIVVDDFSKTNVDGVYSVGNVTGKCGQSPVAVKEGQIVANNIFGKRNIKMNYDN